MNGVSGRPPTAFTSVSQSPFDFIPFGDTTGDVTPGFRKPRGVCEIVEVACHHDILETENAFFRMAVATSVTVAFIDQEDVTLTGNSPVRVEVVAGFRLSPEEMVLSETTPTRALVPVPFLGC